MRPIVKPYSPSHHHVLDPTFEPEQEAVPDANRDGYLKKNVVTPAHITLAHPCAEVELNKLQSAGPEVYTQIQQPARTALPAARKLFLERAVIKLSGRKKKKRKPCGDFSYYGCCSERTHWEQKLKDAEANCVRCSTELSNVKRARDEEVEQLQTEATNLSAELSNKLDAEDQIDAEDSLEALRAQFEVLEPRLRIESEERRAKIEGQRAELDAIRSQTRHAQQEANSYRQKVAAQRELHKQEMEEIQMLPQGPSSSTDLKRNAQELQELKDQARQLEVSLAEVRVKDEEHYAMLEKEKSEREQELERLHEEVQRLKSTASGVDSSASATASGTEIAVHQDELRRRKEEVSILLQEISALHNPASDLLKMFGEDPPIVATVTGREEVDISTEWVRALALSISSLRAKISSASRTSKKSANEDR